MAQEVLVFLCRCVPQLLNHPLDLICLQLQIFEKASVPEVLVQHVDVVSTALLLFFLQDALQFGLQINSNPKVIIVFEKEHLPVDPPLLIWVPEKPLNPQSQGPVLANTVIQSAA